MKEIKIKSIRLEYVPPKIEVIEIEIEGAILSLSSGKSDGPSGPSMSSKW